MRLPLKYHGGKSYLASHIRALFPAHTHYVEPFFGSGAVLFAGDGKGVSEVINDIDRRLINFWRVLQCGESRIRLVDLLQYTPVSEDEWEQAFAHFDRHRCPACIDAQGIVPCVRCAWKFFILSRQSMAGRMRNFTPLTRKRLRRQVNEQASAWWGAVESIEEVADRLANVVILHDDALAVIRREDSEQTLFYLDPPYLGSTRTAPDAYAHEMNPADHANLLRLVNELKGKVVLSGYPSRFYENMLPANTWKVQTISMPNHAASGTDKRNMIECVWTNFTPYTESLRKDGA